MADGRSRGVRRVLDFVFTCGACGGQDVYSYTARRYADSAARRDGWGTDPMDKSVTLCPACMGKTEADCE